MSRAQSRLEPVRWPDLPAQDVGPHLGVAGAYSGVSHGALLLAGGANFPRGYPWEGGNKVWQADIYLLDRPQGTWRLVGRLPRPQGYGASVSWNNRVLCVGGNDAQRRYAEVLALRWDAATARLLTDSLPSLPKPLANLAAAVADDKLYVFGGESDQGAESTLYVLDLQKPQKGWQKRAALPAPARAYTALVAQTGPRGPALYVLGGRQTVADHTTLFADAYEYQIRRNRWRALPPLNRGLSAHGAVAHGPHTVLVVGGDDGERLLQIEALNNQLKTRPPGTEADRLTSERNALQAEHPGFRREVWAYHTLRRTWSLVGTLPIKVPVTTPLVPWEEGFLLPSGEVAPGVRTPAVWQVVVN